MLSGLFSFLFAIVFLFMILGEVLPPLWGIIGIALTSCIIFVIVAHIPAFQANAIGVKVEADMLMIARRFLINLQSGMSLFSAYADVAKTDTYTARFFDEVISKIYLGMPMEEAIEESIRLSPSVSFKKVQTQIKSALLTGSDVEKVFSVTLEEMTKERINQINKYGKQLGPIAMIYMIFGTVAPAIGSVGIVIMASIVLPSVNDTFFTVLFSGLIGGIILVQIMFITLFASIRPKTSI
ncbi:type II secretion system F family protein [Candidatus Woesearchaeota archaeon]|nr:type II secretion system F family protein [Candidatus Woesearchaeota archaeon]